jgi:hypothetical protein
MTTSRAYQKYLLKTQENGTNDNLPVSKDYFVAIFNEAQNKYAEWHLDKRNSDERRNIQQLLVPDLIIEDSTKVLDHYDFELPENYFGFSSAYCFGSKGSCLQKRISLVEVKDENKEEYIIDEDNKPSFLHRESLYQLVNNKVLVYTDDFTVDKLSLSYYRYPQQIQLQDPSNPESQFDDTKSPEFEDRVIDRIISIAAGDYDLNGNNPRFQAQQQRVVNKF